MFRLKIIVGKIADKRPFITKINYSKYITPGANRYKLKAASEHLCNSNYTVYVVYKKLKVYLRTLREKKFTIFTHITYEITLRN